MRVSKTPLNLFSVGANLWSREQVVFPVLLLVYLLTHLPFLLSVPLFNDEIIYLGRARDFPGDLRSTLADGKLIQELFLAISVRLPGDPVLLGRLLSVLCGIGTLIGILLVARTLHVQAAGFLAGIFYATSPMMVFHNRLGIPDSLLTCVASFVLLQSIRFSLAPNPTRRQAIYLGILVGLASLVKFPGLFLFAVPVTLIFVVSPSWQDRWQRLALLRTTLIVALLFIVALAPWHYAGLESDKTSFSTFNERILIFTQNVQITIDILIKYLPGWIVVPMIGLFFVRKGHRATRRIALSLAAAGMVFIAIFLVIGTTIFSRYYMPAWPALLLACGMGISEVWRMSYPGQRVWRLLCVATVSAGLLWNSFFIILLQHDPMATPLIAMDRKGYLENWTAGHNIPTLMDIIEREADKQGKMILVNHDRGRLIHMAASYYLYDNRQIIIQNVDLTIEDAEDQLQAFAATKPTYLLMDGEEYELLQVAQRFPSTEVVAYVEHPTGTMRFYLVRYDIQD